MLLQHEAHVRLPFYVWLGYQSHKPWVKNIVKRNRREEEESLSLTAVTLKLIHCGA